MNELFNLANYGPNPHAERVLLSAIAVLLVGLYVFSQNRRSVTNLAFSLITVSMFVWLSGFGFMSFVKQQAITLYWFKYAEFGVCFIPSSVYFFAVSFVGRFKEKQGWVYFTYLVSLVFAVLLLVTNYFVSGVYEYYWGYYDLFGPLGNIFLIFFSLTMLMALFRFYEGLRKAKTESSRKAIQITFISLTLAYLAAIDFLPHYHLAVYPLGYLFIVIFLLFVARSIIKYKVFVITPALAADNILETMANSVVLLDAAGRILTVNKATCDLLGYEQKELVGKLFSVIGPDLGKLDSDGRISNYETEYRAKSGAAIPVLFSGSVLCDYQEERLGVVCIASDLRELKLLMVKEREESEALRKLEKNLQLLVDERTAELKLAKEKLEENIKELKDFHDLAVGRELKMIDLEKRVKDLEAKLNPPA